MIDMMNGGTYSNSGGFLPERRNYSRFVSQAAKNTVKKKLMEIRRSGARAADEIIDALLKNGEKSHVADAKHPKTMDIAEMVKPEIEKHRGKWRNFLIELATRVAPEFLASFGVNFIYGGILTSSYANVGWTSLLKLDGEKSSLSGAVNGSIRGASSGEKQRKASEILSRGRAKGSMIWIVEGSGTFSSEMLNLYRYEPEIAFILMGNTDKSDVLEAFGELSRLKNVLTVIDENDTDIISKWSRSGMLYAVCSGDLGGREEKCGDSIKDISTGKISNILRSFMENPTFPLRADGIFTLFNYIEALLSGGASNKLPEYRL